MGDASAPDFGATCPVAPQLTGSLRRDNRISALSPVTPTSHRKMAFLSVSPWHWRGQTVHISLGSKYRRAQGPGACSFLRGLWLSFQ